MFWSMESCEDCLLGEEMPAPVRLPVPRVVTLFSHLSFIIMGSCDEFIGCTFTRLVDFMVES